MAEHFDTTFTAAEYSTGLFVPPVPLLGTPGFYTGTDAPSAAANLTIVGDVTTPGSVVTVTGDLGATPVAGLNATYVGFSRASATSEPVYYFTATPAGALTPVAFAVTKGPDLPVASAAIIVDTSASTAPDSPLIPVCFGTGTRIRTARGEVAVEDLRVGDLAATAGGALRPIVWIGHRAIEAGGRPLPHDQQPVRIRAGAFGAGLPARDLRLSPGHPVLVGADADGEGGVLVPIMCLINGTTVVREPATAIGYWHVELDGHDILLAEGLAAESYLDWGDRPFFAEASDHALHNPDFVAPGLSGRCRPVALGGPPVEAERVRLDAVFAAELARQSAWDAVDAMMWRHA